MLAAQSDLRFYTQKKEVILWRISLAERENVKRGEVLADLFEEAGCGPKLVRQAVKGAKSPNLICTLPGDTNSVIVFGAHYDGTEWSQAAADNWSGAALLPSLYQDAKAVKRKHTFVFVGFTGRSDGMLGSEHYAAGLSAQVRAMVNLDTLGLSDTKVWTEHSDAALVKLLTTVAGALHAPLADVAIGQPGDWNSKSFLSRKIRSIDIHSVTPQTAPLPRSHSDSLLIIDGKSYYQTYQLVSVFLVTLDAKLD